jgi:NADH dehydrogenase
VSEREAGIKPRVVIIGGGFAGLAAARVLAQADVRLVMIDKQNHHTFQPLLYQVATAGLTPADIAHPIRSIIGQQANTEVIMGEVTGIDVEQRRVHLGAEHVSFDWLIVASGATHSWFNHDEWAEFATGLKTLDDATTIRRQILSAFERAERASDPVLRKSAMTFVIVGGGPTGVELAGAIAELARHTMARDFRHINPGHARVVLIEAGPRILSAFSEKSSARAMQDLKRLGVEVLTGHRVTRMDDWGVEAGSLNIPCGTKIWAAGVLASPLGKMLTAPLDSAGRVVTTPELHIPGNDRIWVAGDLVGITARDGRPVPGVAPAAMQQGRHVGRNILRQLNGQKPKQFRYVDKGNLATIGRAAAVAELPGLRLSGFLAWLVWVVVHIWFLIDFRNRIVVLFDWALAWFTFRRGARLITGTPVAGNFRGETFRK